jgi:acyl-CoA hydrolase
MAERISSIDDFEAGRWVRPGETVVWGQVGAEPLTLTESLLEQRAEIGGYRCFFGMSVSGTIRPEHADCVSFASYTASGSNQALARAGKLEILPIHYSDYPRFFASGRLPCDVVLLALSPPDEQGRYSLGIGDEYLSAAIDAARVVIAEVNDQVPWTHSRLLTEADLDLVLPTSRPPARLAAVAAGEVETRIAAHVAELVEDGSTLQTGLGALPDAILAALSGHRGLGLHTGAIGDRALDLIEAGVIDNSRKTVDRGRSVAAVLMGSERLLRFAERNPELQLRDTAYTHSAELLASQERFVAINAAFEVDLTGQINAEVAGGRYLGAVGGSMDFLRGAARSPGGLPLVALPATAGDRSRIVGRLNGPVSTPRADAGVIVTEHGAADLRGLTLDQRRRRMLEIVDPDHREAVESEAATVFDSPPLH